MKTTPSKMAKNNQKSTLSNTFPGRRLTLVVLAATTWSKTDISGRSTKGVSPKDSLNPGLPSIFFPFWPIFGRSLPKLKIYVPPFLDRWHFSARKHWCLMFNKSLGRFFFAPLGRRAGSTGGQIWLDDSPCLRRRPSRPWRWVFFWENSLDCGLRGPFVWGLG